jgi:AcrR family transcriptional regulator
VSARRAELLERAYDQVLTHGLADMSLRPLATAIGSSPRVLLLLFGSKDGLVRALLGRAREDELAMLASIQGDEDPAAAIWRWLSAPEHRPLLVLWAEAYVRSLVDPEGPWAGFARQTVEDWLEVLPTDTLAVLRGALLDLLATGDVERTTAAVTSRLSGGGA